MFLIDKENKKAFSIEKKSFSELKLTERNDLQEWIADNPLILGERLLIIQKEFSGFSDTKERLDLLALDENGKLVIIENKLDDSGKDVTWQALKYVSYCATLRKEEICDIYQKYLGEGSLAEDKLVAFFDEQDFENIRLNSVDSDQRIIFVAANFRKEVTSTVLWLRDHGVDITCVKVTPYKIDGKIYLDAERILPLQDVGDYQIKLSVKKQEDIVSANNSVSWDKARLRFWEQAIPVLRERTGLFLNLSPGKTNWLDASFGVSGVVLNVIILINGVRAELYIDTGDRDRNKQIFNALFKYQEQINAKTNSNLNWQELPDRKASKISISTKEYGLGNEESWGNAVDFMTESIQELKAAFLSPLTEAMKS